MNNKLFIIGAIGLTIGLAALASVYTNNRETGSTPNSLGDAGQTSISEASSDQKNKAPDFSLQKLDGSTITLSQFQGQKPVILDFFATWCPNCQRDMPKLSKWYEEKYKDQVEVIGINLRESSGTVENFVESRGISFPIALDPRSQVANAYGIRYTNTHILIDKEGNIVREIPGDIRESDIQSLVEGL